MMKTERTKGIRAALVSAFLLGPDGRQVRTYNAIEVKPETVTADIESLLRQG